MNAQYGPGSIGGLYVRGPLGKSAAELVHDKWYSEWNQMAALSDEVKISTVLKERPASLRWHFLPN